MSTNIIVSGRRSPCTVAASRATRGRVSPCGPGGVSAMAGRNRLRSPIVSPSFAQIVIGQVVQMLRLDPFGLERLDMLAETDRAQPVLNQSRSFQIAGAS